MGSCAERHDVCTVDILQKCHLYVLHELIVLTLQLLFVLLPKGALPVLVPLGNLDVCQHAFLLLLQSQEPAVPSSCCFFSHPLRLIASLQPSTTIANCNCCSHWSVLRRCRAPGLCGTVAAVSSATASVSSPALPPFDYAIASMIPQSTVPASYMPHLVVCSHRECISCERMTHRPATEASRKEAKSKFPRKFDHCRVTRILRDSQHFQSVVGPFTLCLHGALPEVLMWEYTLLSTCTIHLLLIGLC